MWSKAFLVWGFIMAAYITRLCCRSPNAIPKNRHRKDRIMSVPIVGFHGPRVQEYTILLVSVIHILSTIFLPALRKSPLCPYPDHVNLTYFTWTIYVKICLFLIYAAGFLRLQAFRALGSNFTFELAKPDKLVTTGIYAHVQHPSYPPFLILNIVNIALFTNLDGAAGCIFPWELINAWRGMRWWLLAAFGLIVCVGLWGRVKDEEDMLRETFGDRWEQWHKKTARFIPGII
jgi:protein-S-isoprenylcysteine O-methyltransferase Ste14